MPTFAAAAPLVAVAFLGLACACPARPAARAPAAVQAEIGRVIDDWHDAAARSDEARYFSHLHEDAVFLGTDATERWDKQAFREYAGPRFAAGRGWVFRSARRIIVVSAGGEVAWFDELLETRNMGPARGSGVVVRDPGSGRYTLAHYHLAVTVPNERFLEVKSLLESPPPAGP